MCHCYKLVHFWSYILQAPTFNQKRHEKRHAQSWRSQQIIDCKIPVMQEFFPLLKIQFSLHLVMFSINLRKLYRHQFHKAPPIWRIRAAENITFQPFFSTKNNWHGVILLIIRLNEGLGTLCRHEVASERPVFMIIIYIETPCKTHIRRMGKRFCQRFSGIREDILVPIIIYTKVKRWLDSRWWFLTENSGGIVRGLFRGG